VARVWLRVMAGFGMGAILGGNIGLTLGGVSAVVVDQFLWLDDGTRYSGHWQICAAIGGVLGTICGAPLGSTVVVESDRLRTCVNGSLGVVAGLAAAWLMSSMDIRARTAMFVSGVLGGLGMAGCLWVLRRWSWWCGTDLEEGPAANTVVLTLPPRSEGRC
jgi:hypothetical protein